MGIGLLGALVIAGICGPLLAIPRRLGVPVAAGEILIGVILGRTGFSVIPISDSTLKTFSTIGFALVMLTAGSHVNFRALANAAVMRTTSKILVLNVVISLGVGLLVSHFSGVKSWQLLSLIVFSSSAAFVVPIIVSLQSSYNISVLIAQVTIADLISSVSLPFVIQTKSGARPVLGAIAVGLCSLGLYLFLKLANRKGWIVKVHLISKRLDLGLELRISLGILLLVSAISIRLQSSVLIAGFGIGVVLASVGVPRRLARQLFGISDGFFAPIFFILLGASIDLRATFQNGKTVLLVLLMVAGAFLIHFSSVVLGQRRSEAVASIAQMGIPAAAVTLGSASGVLTPGQSGAIMLSAVITLLISSIALRKILGAPSEVG